MPSRAPAGGVKPSTYILRRSDSIFEKTSAVLRPGFGKRQPAGFAGEALQAAADGLSDGAADRKETHGAGVLDGINDRPGRLRHLDDVAQGGYRCRYRGHRRARRSLCAPEQSSILSPCNTGRARGRFLRRCEESSAFLQTGPSRAIVFLPACRFAPRPRSDRRSNRSGAEISQACWATSTTMARSRGPITCLRNWAIASRWLRMYPAWLPLTSATSATVSGRSDSCQKFWIARGWPLSSTLKSRRFEISSGRAVASRLPRRRP